MSFEWSDELEEMMVTMWEERACLYVVTLKSYHCKAARGQAVSEIVAAIGCSEKQLLSRMASLRTSYVRLSKPGKSGEAGKTLTSKNKWIISRMQFLAPHIKARQSLTNFQDSDDSGDLIDGSSSGVSGDNTENALEEGIVNLSTKRQSNTPSPNSSKKMAKHSKNQQEEAEIKLLQEISTHMHQVNSGLQQGSDAPDGIHVFTQHISCQLRNIRNRRTLLTVQHRIQQLVFDAMIGECDTNQITTDYTELNDSYNSYNSSMRSALDLLNY